MTKVLEPAAPSGTTPPAILPARFRDWFSARGWRPRQHQLDLLAAAQAGEDALLIAPTGAGKTLAGFLPSLVELAQPANRTRLHTLYISPLKALAVDVERNLGRPVADLGLGVRIETRTGDTSAAKRKRQRVNPPDMLLTTPEQLALLLASPDAAHLFADLRRVVFDELHAITASKRGDLLSLDLARLRAIAPMMRTTGLSATVRDPAELQRWLVGQGTRPSPSPARGRRRPDEVGSDGGTLGLPPRQNERRDDPSSDLASRGHLLPQAGEGEGPSHLARLITAPPGANANLSILDTEQRMPWSGHSARHALAEVYAMVRRACMTLIFTNTRSQAEFIFQALWGMNDDNLPIALHHGSLDASQRRRVEAAMAEGRLKAVVCTSTLDLGIDWGDVDLVVNIGAPKGASRLTQRIGRANHRLDEPSVAVLVPSNRFEVLECRAALDAAAIGAQDTAVARAGALDVLCQHILGMACAAPFEAEALYAEVTSAEPYAGVSRDTFDKALAFVAHGGYALAGYERFAKIKEVVDKDGVVRWRAANGRVAQTYRMNVGTIVEATVLKVRLVRGHSPSKRMAAASESGVYTGPLRRGGRVLGELEEGFLESLVPGDTFLFGGEILALQGIVENEALVSRSRSDTPRVPTYAGGKFPLSTYLAEGVRRLLADPDHWGTMPMQVAEWLELQRERSALPPPGDLLVETFPRGNRHYLVCYPFEGRLAHQTLGMLLTRRMERAYLKPLGFVANDYALAVWAKTDLGTRAVKGLYSIDELFAQDMLGDDLEDWLRESALMKRTFRQNAIISGLIERNFIGKAKTGRQVTISTDLIYDVLHRHEPDHILLQAARLDASTGLLDLVRLAAMLRRIEGRILHKDLEKISPLAVPIMLEMGREPIHGEGRDAILAEAEAELVREATG